jgi:hypothetical protein
MCAKKAFLLCHFDFQLRSIIKLLIDGAVMAFLLLATISLSLILHIAIDDDL